MKLRDETKNKTKKTDVREMSETLHVKHLSQHFYGTRSIHFNLMASVRQSEISQKHRAAAFDSKATIRCDLLGG